MIKLTFNNHEYQFIGKAMIGAHYRFEAIYGRAFDQQNSLDGIRLLYVILMNDNPDDSFDLTFDQFLAGLDTETYNAMQTQLINANKVGKADAEKKKSKKKKEKKSPTVNSTANS